MHVRVAVCDFWCANIYLCVRMIANACESEWCTSLYLCEDETICISVCCYAAICLRNVCACLRMLVHVCMKRCVSCLCYFVCLLFVQYSHVRMLYFGIYYVLAWLSESPHGWLEYWLCYLVVSDWSIWWLLCIYHGMLYLYFDCCPIASFLTLYFPLMCFLLYSLTL